MKNLLFALSLAFLFFAHADDSLLGRAAWMSGKYGVMVHWIFSEKGAAEETAAQFDLDGFMADFDKTGADWLVFTVGQNRGTYAAPSKTLMSLDSEKCPMKGNLPTRDVVGEIAAAVHARGKRFIAYLPCEVESNSPIREACGWMEDPPQRPRFQQFWTSVIREWSERWGKNCDGWCFDGCYERAAFWPDGALDTNLWVSAVRAGNPDSVTAFNPGCVEFVFKPTEQVSNTKPRKFDGLCDYLAGELNLITEDGMANIHMWGPRKVWMPEGPVVPGTKCLNHPLFPIDGMCGDQLWSFLRNMREVGAAATVNIGVNRQGRMNPQSLALFADSVAVDFTSDRGKVKPLNGVNNQPVRLNGDQQWEFHNANIPYMRTHDTFGMWGGKFIDIHNIFPNFDADENDPKSYDFAFTDRYLASTVKAGVKIFYRLGTTIENCRDIKAYNIYPPKDYAKWARVCEHVIRHYNEGWANGYKWNIEYWEIWNEPENDQMWTGTMEQYFALYEVAAKHLKQTFPALKIGGYASSGFFAVDARYGWEATDRIKSFPVWFEAFLKFVKERDLPLDFFSWHLYTDDPDRLANHAKYVRDHLDRAGFEKTESILNEWNRIEFGNFNQQTFVELKDEKGAAFVTAAFSRMQYGSVDLSTYYDALPTRSYCGLFSFPTLETTKCYEAFAAFGELLKLGTAVEAKAYGRDLYVIAAKGEGVNDKAILVANHSAYGRTVELSVTGGAPRYSLARIDAENAKLIPTGIVEDGQLTLPPWGVVLLKPVGKLVGRTDFGPVLGETEMFTVTPDNGVWDLEYGRTQDPKDISFSFKLYRHREGVRVVAKVIDDKVVTDDCIAGSLSCPSWDDDNLECFFDGNNDKSTDSRAGDGLKYGGEFTFVANNAAQSDFSGWPKSFGELWYGTVTVTPQDGGYVLDYNMFFTWECLGKKVPPKDDEKVAFGFNTCVHDDDDGKRNDHALYWKGNPKIPYRDESQFGTIEF